FAENIEQRENTNGRNYYGHSLRFPLVLRILGQPVDKVERYQAYEWTFGSFLTDFYNVNGLLSLFFWLVLFIEFFRYQFKQAKHDLLKFTYVYTFYIHFIISGLFYFRLGTFS